MKDVLKIVLGIASGLVIAGIAWLIISAYIAKTAIEQITKTSQNTLIQIQKNAEAAAQKQREKQTLIETAQLNAKTQEFNDQQAAIELRKEKTRAWEKFYTKSPECENPSTMNVMGDCANIAIRAKRKFEEQWNASHPTSARILPPTPKPILLQTDKSLPPGFEPYTPPGSVQHYGTQ